MNLKLPHLRFLAPACICVASSLAGAQLAATSVLHPRVVIVTYFEVGADTGDRPGELQFWVERDRLDRVIQVPGMTHAVRANAAGTEIAVAVGPGNIKPGINLMALGADPRFDLRQSHWLINGIAGTSPADGTIGDAVWTDFVIDGDLAKEAIAEATGGLAYYERNDLDTLMTRAAESGTNYYTLSYSPPSLAYDGRYHAIAVQTDKPGLHLVYRKGYSAEDPQQLARSPETAPGSATREAKPSASATDPLSAAMTPIVPPATQLLFDVRAEPDTTPPSSTDPPGAVLGALNPKLSKAPLTRYSFLFAVPARQIAFTAGDAGTYSGSLEFDIAAYDPDGHLVTIRSQTMKFPLTADEYKPFIATPFQFLQQIDLPPGQITLRAGVLDGVSQKLGTLDIPLTVPKK